MSDARTETDRAEQHEEHDHGGDKTMYLRFVGMIVTATVVMYALMYVNTYELSHVKWSETRLFMALLMGGSMAMIMLGFMMRMLSDRRLNAVVVAVGVALIALGTGLVRTQGTVEERSYMSAMIPHHSIAILTSENSEIEDVRVCELAVEIITAQRREINEMEWLIDDIAENGTASTASEAEHRPVPSFEGTSIRTCPKSMS